VCVCECWRIPVGVIGVPRYSHSGDWGRIRFPFEGNFVFFFFFFFLINFETA
jgi:hypothetical protein